MGKALLSRKDLNLLPYAYTGFADLRNNGMIYVDKTDMVCELAESRGPFFLSRPRRFGKSLLLSTFESLFADGLKDFAGLKIEKLWTENKTYPVIRIDFSQLARSEDAAEFADVLRKYLVRRFIKCALTEFRNPADYSLCPKPADVLDQFLDSVPDSSVVLLIDEYDAPIHHCLENRRLLQEVLALTGNFYNTVKSYQRKLRFTFITGITRVAHVSLFSTFNNLKDITLNERYASLLGITDAELHQYFDSYVQNAASVNDMTSDEVYERMKARYDGFRFTVQAKETLYSPWSVLSFLQEPQQGFGNYWWGTSQGVPTVLVDYLKKKFAQRNQDELELKHSELILQDDLEAKSEPGQIPESLLMLQAGIYTLRYANHVQVRLEYPNEEVEECMLRLKRDVQNLQLPPETHTAMGKLADMVDDGNIDGIIEVFNLYLNASLSPDTKLFGNENDVRDFIFAGIPERGLTKYKEKTGMQSRSDMELVTAHARLVIEFKRSETDAGVARMLKGGLNQIERRNYGAGQDERKLRQVCMVISTESRGITAWVDADAKT